MPVTVNPGFPRVEGSVQLFAGNSIKVIFITGNQHNESFSFILGNVNINGRNSQ